VKDAIKTAKQYLLTKATQNKLMLNILPIKAAIEKLFSQMKLQMKST
jgi:hypothetical protein